MQKTQFGGLLNELWRDLQQPAVLWQVAVLALCLGLAWAVARAVRRRTGETQEAQFGKRGLKRLAFPLAALVFVLVARDKRFRIDAVIYRCGVIEVRDIAALAV